MAIRKKLNQYKFVNIWDFDVVLTGNLASGTGQVISLSGTLPIALQDTTLTYRITIDRNNIFSAREVLEVSSDGTSLTTVTRGVEGTADTSHAIGESVAVSITAGDMSTVYDMLDVFKKGYVYHETQLNINHSQWSGYINSQYITTTPATIALSPSSTNYIEVTEAGIVSSPSWGEGTERLATVITNASTVISISDERTFNNANNASRDVNMMMYDATANVIAANGVGFFIVPASLNGLKLSSVKAKVITQGTGGATTVDVIIEGGVSYLNAPISIAQTTNLTVATINTPTTVLTDDVIQINVTGAETTPAKGLILLLTFS